MNDPADIEDSVLQSRLVALSADCTYMVCVCVTVREEVSACVCVCDHVRSPHVICLLYTSDAADE